LLFEKHFRFSVYKTTDMRYKPFLSLLAISLCCAAVQAQPKRVMTAEKPIDSLNDDFANSQTLAGWQQWHTTEGQPDKWKTLAAQNGLLQLQPYASGWYGDYAAPFMFKMVEGNFDVRTKIKVRGEKDGLPQTEWSLAGLMVRQPRRAGAAPEPRSENWLFLTTGIAEPKGSPVMEAKSTTNSISNLKLRPAREGWVELRIVRVQASFILLYRYEGEAWTVLERLYRPQLPYQLQVGINAYSGWNVIPGAVREDAATHNKTVLTQVPTDMVVEVDYVLFARPTITREKLNAFFKTGFTAPYYTPGNVLTDYAIPDSDLLQIINAAAPDATASKKQ
jgi:hypothetical protein